MKTPFVWKAYLSIRHLIMRIFHHEYGCCNAITKNCSKCEYVIREQSAQAGKEVKKNEHKGFY